MTFDELHGEYIKMCNNQDCDDCKYNDNFPCQLPFGYDKGRSDAIDEFVKEMGKFWGGLKAMDEIEFVAKKLKEHNE